MLFNVMSFCEKNWYSSFIVNKWLYMNFTGYNFIPFYGIFIMLQLCWIYELTWLSISSRNTKSTATISKNQRKSNLVESLTFRLGMAYFKSTLLLAIKCICRELFHTKPFWCICRYWKEQFSEGTQPIPARLTRCSHCIRIKRVSQANKLLFNSIYTIKFKQRDIYKIYIHHCVKQALHWIKPLTSFQL